jgi:hypothetical protein
MSEVSKIVLLALRIIFVFFLLDRFATELSGRKARRQSWVGLAEEMVQAGWFDT